MPSIDSHHSRKELKVGDKTYVYYSLRAAEAEGLDGISRLPVSMKVLLENLLRHEDNLTVREADLKAVAAWVDNKGSVEHEISFRPARVLMQDFTGVPAVVDLAAMRDAMTKLGGDPEKINPLNPVDLVIDHSVMVDYFGKADSFQHNVAREYERNLERYRFLRWGSSAFSGLRVVPPGTGICHQVNLEYLAQTVWLNDGVAYPDTVVGKFVEFYGPGLDHLSVAVAPSGMAPDSLKPITSGISIGIGWPSMAASASMPPTPQPSTDRPLIMVVWLSVPTTVSG